MNERLEDLEHQIIMMLPYAYSHEIKVKASITKQPDLKQVLALQNGELEPKD